MPKVYTFKLFKVCWTEDTGYLWIFFYPHRKTFFIVFRGRGRERRRKRETLMWERNIYWLPSICVCTCDWACSLGVCPEWESNPQILGYRRMLQLTKSQWPGWILIQLLGMGWFKLTPIFLEFIHASLMRKTESFTSSSNSSVSSPIF